MDRVVGEDHKLDANLEDENLLKYLRGEPSSIKSIDPQVYAQAIEHQLRHAEQDAVFDYMNEADRLATLHKQIQEFDRVLAGMQDVLSGFQNQLGNISGEINSLQEQSVKMNQKLKNRKIAKGQLGEFIEAVVLPPDFIKSIYTMDVTNEGYGNLLNMLSKKRIQLSKLVQSKASAEAAPNLNELTLEAVAKVYKFLQDLIVELQTPKTNIQIKQSYLRKYRPLMQFLDEQDPKTALEIRNNYTNVLGGIYFNIFRKYINDVIALVRKDLVVDKSDLIGTEVQRNQQGLFGSSNAIKKNESHIIEVLSIGNRTQVFKDMEEEVKYHVAIKNGEKMLFEEAFAAISRAIMNSAVSEYLFLIDFFGSNTAKSMFLDILSKTFQAFLEQIELFLFGCNDAICVLLVLRVLYKNQLFMLERKVPVLENLFERINSMLWPKFKSIMDAQVDSIRKLYPSLAQVKDSSLVYVYFVSRRYAELSSALTILNKENKDDIVNRYLAILRQEIEALFKRMSGYIESPQDQVIYLINLFDIIFRVYANKGISSDDSQYLQDIQKSYISVYIEDELQTSASFARMISLVKTMPDLADGKENDGSYSVKEEVLAKVVKDFKENWREGIEAINDEILYHFTEKWKQLSLSGDQKGVDNQQNDISIALNIPFTEDSPGSQTEVMKQILTQLITYYDKFQVLLQRLNASQNVTRDLVSRQSLLFEVKKYNKGGK